jgi:phosphate transport system permease protein
VSAAERSVFARRLRSRIGDSALLVSTATATLLVLIALGIIMIDVAGHGLPRLSWTFLTTAPTKGMTEGGVFPAIFGTVAMTVMMTIAVVPAGVATAIYLHEYADRESWLTRVIRVAVNNLAGVPSIVFGLFGLGFFIQFMGGGIDRIFFSGHKVFGQPALRAASSNGCASRARWRWNPRCC